MTRFKELCLDVHGDPAVLGEFWSAVTGVPYVRGPGPGEPGDLVGDVEGMGIALCPVPEVKTVKNRVHLDVHTDSVDTLLALGASLAPGYDNAEDAWTVLLDPEGGELCAFVRDEVPAYKVYELTVDSADAEQNARWWADVLGGTYGEKDQDEAWVERIPGAPFDCIVFGTVPEPKTVKNRIHWDVRTDDLALLTDAGATVLTTQPRWTVMADPEGNEFCAFLPDRGD